MDEKIAKTIIKEKAEFSKNLGEFLKADDKVELSPMETGLLALMDHQFPDAPNPEDVSVIFSKQYNNSTL